MNFKLIFQALGIKVDPAQVERDIKFAQTLIPTLAAKVEAMETKLDNIERMLKQFTGEKAGHLTFANCPRCGCRVNAPGHCDDCKMEQNRS